MDEPFSALNVLTAETLRGDFLDLWSDGRLPIRGVVLVTHNIEEAVLTCDRVLVFGSHLGRIVDEVAIVLPRLRDRLDPAFREVVERLYVALTEQEVPGRTSRAATDHLPGSGIGIVLPRVSSNLLACLAETLARPPYGGEADLPVLAAALHLAIDDLFPIAETLQMLRCRGGRRRRAAHRSRAAVRRDRDGGAQTSLSPPLARLRTACRPYPPRPRRTPESWGAVDTLR